jgi:hypothetical protein
VGRNAGVPATVNAVGTALECFHETAERDVEYGTHQQGQSPACKFIAQIEPYVAAAARPRLKSPPGSQLPQWPIGRLDQDASVGTIERNTADERFTPDAARDHVGYQDLGISARFAGPNGMSEAERDEFRIAFDVGYEIEHFIHAVVDAPLRLKNRHFSLRRSILTQDAALADGK